MNSIQFHLWVSSLYCEGFRVHLQGTLLSWLYGEKSSYQIWWCDFSLEAVRKSLSPIEKPRSVRASTTAVAAFSLRLITTSISSVVLMLPQLIVATPLMIAYFIPSYLRATASAFVTSSIVLRLCTPFTHLAHLYCEPVSSDAIFRVSAGLIPRSIMASFTNSYFFSSAIL